MGRRGGPLVVSVQRSVVASPEEVWAAWTEPARLARWFTTEAELDVRPGGGYATADGDRGTYLRVEPPRRLRFTWDHPEHAPGTVVDLAIDARAGGGSLVRLEHRGLPDREAFEDLQEGWAWALASLESFLESGEGLAYEAWAAKRG